MRIIDLPLYHVFHIGRKRYYRVDSKTVYDMDKHCLAMLNVNLAVDSVRPGSVALLLKHMSTHPRPILENPV